MVKSKVLPYLLKQGFNLVFCWFWCLCWCLVSFFPFHVLIQIGNLWVKILWTIGSFRYGFIHCFFLLHLVVTISSLSLSLSLHLYVCVCVCVCVLQHLGLQVLTALFCLKMILSHWSNDETWFLTIDLGAQMRTYP